MQTCGDQSGDVGNITHQVCADLFGDVGEGIEIDCSRICRVAGDDQLRITFLRQLADRIHVKLVGFLIQAVMHYVIKLSRDVDLQARRKMPAVRQIQ